MGARRGGRRRRQGRRPGGRQGRHRLRRRRTTRRRERDLAAQRRPPRRRRGAAARAARRAVIALCDGARRAARCRSRATTSGSRDGDRGPEHRRHGRRTTPLAGPARRRRRRDPSTRSTGRSSPSSPGAARRSVGALYAGPDADRRRPGPARVQRPLRRPRDAGRSCRGSPRRSGRSCSPRRAGRLRRAPGPSRRPDAAGARRSAIVLARRRLPGRAGRGRSRSTGSTAPADGGALVFHAATARDADGDGWETAGGRVLTVVGRGPDLERRARGRGARRGRDRLAPASSAATTSARPTAAVAAAALGAAPMIRRYTLPEMGAIWTERARFEAMLRGRARGQPAPRPRAALVPADALAAIEARRRGRRRRGSPRSSRRPTTTSSRSCSQVAEAVGPEGRYLHLGLTEQRRRRHRASRSSSGPPASACSADCDRLLAALDRPRPRPRPRP